MLASREKILRLAIVTSAVIISAADIIWSSYLLIARLFTLPLALCAFQTSTGLVATTTAIATISTCVAGLRIQAHVADLTDALHRGLLVASLLVFAAFIYLVMRNIRQRTADAERIKVMSADLAARNAELSGRVDRAVSEASEREVVTSQLAASERHYRGLLESCTRRDDRHRQGG